jgi:hypothetical protein
MTKEVIYTELYSHQTPVVDTLFKIYANDKFKARVYYMNENSHIFTKSRLVVFEIGGKDFDIVYFERKYGISKTDKMYNRESRIFTIMKRGNKFYYKAGKIFMPLTVSHILHSGNNTMISGIVAAELIKRLPWLRYLTEIDIIRSTSLNTIYSKKLFSLDKALRYQYKTTLPCAKLLHALAIRDHRVTYLRYYIEYMVNMENLHNTLPKYDFGLFYDTIKMAKTLNKKVNCSWSPTRLKLEHDNWSREIGDIVFVDGDRELSISDIYLNFAEKSGFKILKTTKEMAIEGRVNQHCVGTYISKVESGQCGIYHVKGHTLELKAKWVEGNSELVIVQFRGLRNCNAPKELEDLVISELNKCNEKRYEDLVGGKLNNNNLAEIFDLNDIF